MHKSLTLALAALVSLTAGLQAKEVSVVKSDKIAKITFPDDWTVTEEDDIINAKSKDETISLDVEVASAENLDAVLEETVKYLKENKVTIDEKTLKESEGKINGLDAVFHSYDGKDEDGPCVVSLCFVMISEEKLVSILHWSPAKVDEAEQKKVLEILGSVKKK